ARILTPAAPLCVEFAARRQERCNRGNNYWRNQVMNCFKQALSCGAAAAALVVGCALSQPAAAADVKTVTPGKLTVAFNGDMPMTSEKDGKLIGTDGELMMAIGQKLGLEVVPKQMDWAAEIESTKQGKVDIMHGAMGWLKPRTEIMTLTDPIYYFGTLL